MGTGNGDRTIANDRGFFVELPIFAYVHVASGFSWRYFAVIKESGLAAGKADQHKSAATDVARGGFDDGERECYGDGRVDSVAASLQDLDSSLRAEFLISSDHTMTGANSPRRPALGITLTVAQCCRSLAASQRRSQANDENTKAERISYSHCSPKTLRDSCGSVKARE